MCQGSKIIHHVTKVESAKGMFKLTFPLGIDNLIFFNEDEFVNMLDLSEGPFYVL